MYDTEALATRVANRAASMMRMHRIFDVQEKVFTNLAITGAMREASYIFRDLDGARETIPLLIGETVSETCQNITFSEIVEILCSDNVLNRAIDILKQMHQNRWRPYRNLPRNQQRSLHRENYIQRSHNNQE